MLDAGAEVVRKKAASVSRALYVMAFDYSPAFGNWRIGVSVRPCCRANATFSSVPVRTCGHQGHIFFLVAFFTPFYYCVFEQ